MDYYEKRNTGVANGYYFFFFRMHSLNRILFLLTSMSLSSNGFYFMEKPPMIEPNRSTIVAVNKMILLSCKDGSIKKMSIFLNDTLVKRENTSYVEYNLTSDKPVTYKFRCQSGLKQNYVMIIFRHSPQVVSAKTVITDRNFCYMVVNFTFVHLKKDDYVITKRYENENKSFNCNSSTTCEFSCTLYKTYIFKIVISSKDLAHYERTWTIHASPTFYKLNKLTDLRISAKSSETLSLSYKDINNSDNILATHCDYRITYKSEWDEMAKNVTTNKREIVLRNLVPYTMYTIDIQAKLSESIYWNDKLTHKEKTLPSAPYAGPQSANGSFLETTCVEKSKRCFILYWAMIPVPLRNGILDGYVIKQDGNILKETSELFAKIKDQPKNKNLWFEIRAKMNNSRYSPPTVIYIPLKGPHKLKSLCVVRLNDTHFNISWALQQPLKNLTVTVMSCLGVKPGSTLLCKANVMWTKIKDQNFTILKAEKEAHFAASVNNLEGSSSLTLSECVLTQGIARTPQQARISQTYPTQMNLLWPTYNCKDLNGKPILFQILYAKQNNCSNGLQVNIPAIGTKLERENIEIKNLTPFTNYSICLRIRTVQGWSKMSPQLTTSTPETNPSGSVRNLQVVNIDNSSVTLKWDPVLQPNGIITSHIVDYQRFGDKTQRLLDTDAPNMATVNHLQPLSEYTFRVSACNDAGCSMKSANVNASISIGSPFVSDLQLSPISEHQLEIRWKLPAFLSNYFQYYMLEVMYGKKVLRYNETEDVSKTTISCDAYDNVLVTVNVAVVIKYNNSLIYGDPKKVSKMMCPKSESNLPIVIALPILMTVIFFVCCGCCTHWMYKKYKETDLDLIYPNVPPDTSSSDDIDVKDSPYYTEIDLDSEIKLMDNNTVEFSSTDGEEEEEKVTEITILEDDNDSKEEVSMTDFGRNKFSTNQEKNERNLHGKLSLSNLDSNGYMQADIKLSDCNSHGNDPIALSSKLNSAHLDSNSDRRSRANNLMDSSKLKESNLNSKDYLLHDLSNSSRSNSDLNSSAHIALSDLSQADSKTNGYVQNNLMVSGLKPENLDSNGYMQNNMESFSSNQADLQADGYVQNSAKSCDSNQADSQSDGYVQNSAKSCDSNQADLQSDGYVQNSAKSCDSNQADIQSDGYVQNSAKSCDSNQADSQSDGYVQNSAKSCDSNQADSQSDGYVQNSTKSCGSNQADSETNDFIQKNMTSDLSQADSDSNGYISDLSQSVSDSNNDDQNNMSLLDSNGYVQNTTTPFDVSQVHSDSNEYVQNMKTSDLSLSDSDSSGYSQNNTKPADSNFYVQKNMTPFDLSQVNLDFNDYVQV